VALSRGRFEKLDERGRAQQRLFPDELLGKGRTKDARWRAEYVGVTAMSPHLAAAHAEPKPQRHERKATLATMEEVCELLKQAFENVASNKGAPAQTNKALSECESTGRSWKAS